MRVSSGFKEPSGNTGRIHSSNPIALPRDILTRVHFRRSHLVAHPACQGWTRLEGSVRQSALKLRWWWHPRDRTWGFSYKWDTDIALEVLRSDLQIWGCRNLHADAYKSMEPFKMRSFFRHGSGGREKSQWTGHRICNQTNKRTQNVWGAGSYSA